MNPYLQTLPYYSGGPQPQMMPLPYSPGAMNPRSYYQLLPYIQHQQQPNLWPFPKHPQTDQQQQQQQQKQQNNSMAGLGMRMLFPQQQAPQQSQGFPGKVVALAQRQK